MEEKIDTREAKKSFKYFVHFIGKGLYSKEEFVEESKKLGINRALPNFAIKGMKWGTPILCAQYEPPIKQWIDFTETILTESKGRVFGYFQIRGLNFECENKEEFVKRLISQLDVTETFNDSKTVTRKCGSYVVGNTTYVTNELDEIIEKSEALAKEMNIKVKYFAGGSFKPLEDITLSPMRFSRVGTLIEIDEELKLEEENNKVAFIGNYEQKKYYTKEEKEGLINGK
jgi:hypothetical protein